MPRQNYQIEFRRNKRFLKIEKDSIFFALKGPNFDANKFADQALESGAALCVVDDESVVKNNKYFLV